MKFKHITALPHRVKTLLQSLNLRLDLFDEFLYCLIAGDGTTGRTFQTTINIIGLRTEMGEVMQYFLDHFYDMNSDSVPPCGHAVNYTLSFHIWGNSGLGKSERTSNIFSFNFKNCF